MKKESHLNNKPSVDYLWKGLGGQFSNFSQITEEFVDNSISNYRRNKELYNINHRMLINIRIFKLKKYISHSENGVDHYSDYVFEISDNGTGIKDLDNAFKIGGQNGKDSTLNEHGFGLKHALAAVSPENADWYVVTKLLNDSHYTQIKSPYNMDKQPIVIGDNNVKFDGLNHGTIIRFKVSNEMLKTVARGLRKKYESVEELAQLLVEDLGYTYGENLDDPLLKLNVSILDEDSMIDSFQVESLKLPNHYEFRKQSNCYLPKLTETNGKEKGAHLTVKYLCIDPNADDTINVKYYKSNSASAGIEFRVNNRLLCKRSFSSVWNIAQHPNYNGMIVIVNLTSDNADDLPKTTTNKTGFSLENNPIYNDLRLWLSAHVKNFGQYAHVKTKEPMYFKAVKDYYQEDNPNDETYDTEVNVYNDFGLDTAIDFYHHDNNKVTIYEGKLSALKPIDVCQLRMYWDGLVQKNSQIDEGILVSDRISQPIKDLIDYYSTLKDDNGNNYNFSYISWNDFQPNDRLFDEYIKYLKNPNNIKYLEYDGVNSDNYNNLSFAQWKELFKNNNSI